MLDHRGARSRWNDDRFRIGRFKDLDKSFREFPRFFPVTSIERRLSAASLSLIECHAATGALKAAGDVSLAAVEQVQKAATGVIAGVKVVVKEPFRA